MDTDARRQYVAIVFFVVLVMVTYNVVAQTRSRPSAEFAGPVKEVIVRERVLFGSAASSQGEISRGEILRFNDGELVEQINYLAEDTFLWRSSFEYDDDGRLVEWSSYDDSDDRRWRYQFFYDENRAPVS